jgi:hypothetical protein
LHLRAETGQWVQYARIVTAILTGTGAPAQHAAG